MDHFLWAAETKSDTFSPFHTCAPRHWREKIGQEEIKTVKSCIRKVHFWYIARCIAQVLSNVFPWFWKSYFPFHTCAPRQRRKKIGQEDIETCIGAGILKLEDFRQIRIGRVTFIFQFSNSCTAITLLVFWIASTTLEGVLVGVYKPTSGNILQLGRILSSFQLLF